MNIDYNTSKEIAQRFFVEAYNSFKGYGVDYYQAVRKAEQEVLKLQVNPFTGTDYVDHKACEDLVAEMRGA